MTSGNTSDISFSADDKNKVKPSSSLRAAAQPFIPVINSTPTDFVPNQRLSDSSPSSCLQHNSSTATQSIENGDITEQPKVTVVSESNTSPSDSRNLETPPAYEKDFVAISDHHSASEEYTNTDGNEIITTNNPHNIDEDDSPSNNTPPHLNKYSSESVMSENESFQSLPPPVPPSIAANKKQDKSVKVSRTTHVKPAFGTSSGLAAHQKVKLPLTQNTKTAKTKQTPTKSTPPNQTAKSLVLDVEINDAQKNEDSDKEDPENDFVSITNLKVIILFLSIGILI
jgi:thiol:disulfide interchange protein